MKNTNIFTKRNCSFAAIIVIAIFFIGAMSAQKTYPDNILMIDKPMLIGEKKLRLIKIEDSRCPIGAQCVWAGEVKLTLDWEGQPLTLKELEETKADDYVIKLLQVNPKPDLNSQIKQKDYRAEISLRAQQN